MCYKKVHKAVCVCTKRQYLLSVEGVLPLKIQLYI